MKAETQPGGRGYAERYLHLLGRAQAKLFTWLISGQFAACGRHVSIFPPLRFANLQFVELGDRVTIHRDCWIHTISRSQSYLPRLVIGSNTGIGMGATISAAREVLIGEHVMMARNVYISDHAHAFDDPDRPFGLQGIGEPKPVNIGSGSWLGQNVCVLPGVTIGRNCVVGANSVVTKHVPELSVAVGAPAKVVKRYNRATRAWEKV